MKKILILLSLTAALATLNSCCNGSSAPAPISSGPSYVAPVK